MVVETPVIVETPVVVVPGVTTATQPSAQQVTTASPTTPAVPMANSALAQNLHSPTAEELKGIATQTERVVSRLCDKLQEELAKGLDDDLRKLPDFASMPAASQQQVRNAVAGGATLDLVLTDAQKGAKVTRRLVRRSEAERQVTAIRKAAQERRLTAGELMALRDQIYAVRRSDADMATINQMLAAMEFFSDLIQLVRTATPGINVLPVGPSAAVALIPAQPRGMLIPLGNGAVLAGTGQGGAKVYVGTGDINQLTSAAMPIEPALPEASAEPVTSGVLVRNNTTLSVSYQLNSQQFTLGPHYTHPLPAGQSWTIQFDRGGSFGAARIALAEGTHDFNVTAEQGWQLNKQSFRATLDNTQNPFPFHYVVNNAGQTLPGGQRQELSTDYPLMVRFDNGRQQTRQKRLESGTYKVGMTPEASMDLYAATAIPSPAQSPDGLPVGFQVAADSFFRRVGMNANGVSTMPLPPPPADEE